MGAMEDQLGKPSHSGDDIGVLRTSSGREIPRDTAPPEERARKYAEWERERQERMGTARVFPEWGGREVVSPDVHISTELRKRFRVWNETWQRVLDPVTEKRWLDPEVGREWIREGEALVSALQDELGPSVRVRADFYGYAPPP